MSQNQPSYDYIVVGGGLAGCTLASLLSQSQSSPSVLLIEAGSDASKHPLTQAPLACFAAHRSDLDWNYQTVPQPHLNDRPVYNAAGKALGGGTATNYATWTRGPKTDYDRWSDLVGDRRWSYDGLLPYFEKIEKHHVTNVAVSKSSPDRRYPLRDRVLEGWLELGLKQVTSANSGDPIGVGELVENFRDGKRQITSIAFDMSQVVVMTETLVRKVLLQQRQGKLTATGVELEDGKQLLATKEVIVSAGAYRTPQLLMLSGIGPAEDLKKNNIPIHLDLPGVGRNFHDHLLVGFAFRLHDEFVKEGAAGPFEGPAYQMGLSADWVVTEKVSASVLKAALDLDFVALGNKESVTYANSLLTQEAAYLETVITYVPGGPPLTNMHAPFDRTHIGAVVGVMSPSSRGRISIQSNSASDAPVIDPHYNEAEVDRALMRYGIRRLLKVVEGPLSDIIASENPPPPFETLSESSSDADIDARVRAEARTFFHAGGTASMGPVVDAELRVIGVEGLRVVDASVLPVPIGAHLQAVTYAVAAQAADMIAGGGREHRG